MPEAKSEFDQFLERAVFGALNSSRQPPLPATKEPLLNGAPYRAFRAATEVSERRRLGTFFSGSALANTLAQMLRARVAPGALVTDPTCGMGDLLLGYASLLPLEPSLKETLQAWGSQLAGMDLSADLIRLTKVRLIMLARSRGKFNDDLDDLDVHFPHIQPGDMLTSKSRLLASDGFLFNPPFGQTSSHDVGGWASGLVNSAAVFLEALIGAKHPSAPIAAVLPEVLRCGSRYERFRRRLESLGISADFVSLGRFDAWTDVDIFATLLREAQDSKIWRSADASLALAAVGDFFDIRVGCVVPHRHPNLGPWRRFVCAKTVPAWSQAYKPANSRRFQGSAFNPPFVVVRRTSSPSDKLRAVGAIVVGEKAVAVENHLIVLSPRRGGITACERLLEVLREAETSTYLNRTIRCRHLTTGAVASIPWRNLDV